ncbi:MAG: hypothetical protein WCL07_01115 [bacterium]
MPSKLYVRNFEPNIYYHLTNFGALGSEIFRDSKDYQTFTFILSYYLRIPHGKPLSYLQTVKAPYTRGATKLLAEAEKPCDLVAFALHSTHFHLIIQEKRTSDKSGISNLMKHLSVTYAMYFNTKYGRSGSLYRGKYKALPIPTMEHLLILTHFLHRHENISDSQTSYPDYIKTTRSWLHPDVALDAVRSHNTLSYRTFVEDNPPNTAFLGNLTLE